MLFEDITPVIISKNSENTINRCLESLKSFKHVVVYDNGSTDDTIRICRLFENVIVIEGDFFGFGPTKNYAAEKAPTDWILSLDSDEELHQSALEELSKWNLQDIKSVGQILRENWFCGKKITTNGWGNDLIIRLYNKKSHTFTDSQVHEKIEKNSQTKTIKLKGKIIHYAIFDIKQTLDKAQLYSEIYASSNKKIKYNFFFIVMKTIFAFFRSYVLKLGVLSGWRGFVISFGDAIGVFFKYAKVYQRSEVKK
ncbi:glycosyltransferase family 2 protein [Vreelandella andesensis]|uniref:Glycosyltransferase family 2 protein n=1 Tax=Vreelandella andesensis TaxID=447567 RepID=A0A3S0W2T7_9GAMM|nr:glycosyltransferase family 2 protein [Halomonas andesensis]RUR30082.1 glycosyltransferase family 2 protein [Halomonas andesensis]